MNPQLIEDGSQYADIEGLFEDKGGKGDGIYLSIFDFSICQRSKSMPANSEGWEGPFERQNPNTKETVISYAKRYDRMIARMVDVYKQTKEFDASKGGGKVTNWNLVLIAGGTKLILQLTYMDHVLKRFLKVAPNIDLSKPILISAFKSMKNGDAKQAVSFRQGEGTDVDKWVKVEEYWRRPLGPDNKPIEGSQSVGADGSILPQPIHDEEDDSWDYKEQNRFLAHYFRDNILPKIKAIAERYGLNQPDQQEGNTDFPTHTGGPETLLTVKPDNPVAANIGDLVSGSRMAEINTILTQYNWDKDAVVSRLFGPNVSIGELSHDAAGYMLHKLNQQVEKRKAQAPEPAPAPPPTVQSVVSQAQAPVPDDDWMNGPEAAAPVAQATSAAKAAPPDDDDDDLWE